MNEIRNTITNARTGQKMIFLKTTRETNGKELEIECFNPPSATKEPEHIHPIQENAFEVISGELSFIINNTLRTIGPGESVVIPRGVPHYFWNEGIVEAHYIQRFTPALKIDSFFRTFFALARDGKLNKKGLPNLFLISIISLNHQDEIRLSTPSWNVQKCIFVLLAPIGRLLGYKSVYE